MAGASEATSGNDRLRTSPTFGPTRAHSRLPDLRARTRHPTRALRQRQDLAVIWLHQDTPRGPITRRQHLRKLPTPQHPCGRVRMRPLRRRPRPHRHTGHPHQPPRPPPTARQTANMADRPRLATQTATTMPTRASYEWRLLARSFTTGLFPPPRSAVEPRRFEAVRARPDCVLEPRVRC